MSSKSPFSKKGIFIRKSKKVTEPEARKIARDAMEISKCGHGITFPPFVKWGSRSYLRRESPWLHCLSM